MAQEAPVDVAALRSAGKHQADLGRRVLVGLARREELLGPEGTLFAEHRGGFGGADVEALLRVDGEEPQLLGLAVVVDPDGVTVDDSSDVEELLRRGVPERGLRDLRCEALGGRSGVLDGDSEDESQEEGTHRERAPWVELGRAHRITASPPSAHASMSDSKKSEPQEPIPPTQVTPSPPAGANPPESTAAPDASSTSDSVTSSATDGESSSPSEGPEERPGGTTLRGTPVAGGLVLGPCHLKDYDLSRMQPQRVALDEVERELNRFHSALSTSRDQLDALKERLTGRVPPDHARILDVHVAYLRDSVFLADVENLILNEQMSLEAAIAKVITDFDRIFRLVENETLRERAVDLRDVGIRVLRNLEQDAEPEADYVTPPADYVLVARELSIVDMFNLEGEHVLGIATEEGSLTSHAAILARSMRIPTVTGVEGLLDIVNESDFLIVDASEGVVRVNPTEVVRAQYRQQRADAKTQKLSEGVPEWAQGPHETRDGEAVRVLSKCGNLPEAEHARELGLDGPGLYKTELLYMLERSAPSLESLTSHYASVLQESGEGEVTFRLLDVDSSVELEYLYEQKERNPCLGRAGVRLLLAREQILRTQLKALLTAGLGRTLRVALPLVNDCGELRRVKEILFEERFAMRRQDPARIELGCVVETPVAAFGVQNLARESDFLIVALDSLLQYTLAADRDNLELAEYFEPLHPVVLQVLTNVHKACRQEDKPLSIFGFSCTRPANLPFLLGIGLREFCIAPAELEEFSAALTTVELTAAEHALSIALRAACQAETLPVVENMKHSTADG